MPKGWWQQVHLAATGQGAERLKIDHPPITSPMIGARAWDQLDRLEPGVSLQPPPTVAGLWNGPHRLPAWYEWIPNVWVHPGSFTSGLMVEFSRVETVFDQHWHRTPEVYLILEGSGVMVAGGVTIPLEPGTLIYLPSGTPHHTETDGLTFVYFFPRTKLDQINYRKRRKVRNLQAPPKVVRLEDHPEPLTQLRFGLNLGHEVGLGAEIHNVKAGRAHILPSRPYPQIIFLYQGVGASGRPSGRKILTPGSYDIVDPHTDVDLQAFSDLTAVVVRKVPKHFWQPPLMRSA